MTICLTMSIGNDSKTIEPCLRSVKPWIQRYVILDTGSLDGSLEIAKRALQGIEGFFFKAPLGTGRKELLRFAKGQGNYLLLVDPDEKLTIIDPLGFGTLDADCYYAVSRKDGIDWRKPFLFRSELDWVGGEFLSQDLASPQAKSAKLLLGSVLWKLRGGAHEERERLKEAFETYPTSPRLLFHYARVSEEAQKESEALELFAKRVSMKGDEQELFYSLYRLAALKEKQGEPLERVIDHYLTAYHSFPSRAEPLYDLSERMIREENYVLGYVLSEFALTIPCPQDPFLQKSWIYEYGLLRQFAHCAFQVKRFKESKEALEKLLKIPTLPLDQRSAMEKNYLALLSQGELR